MNPIAFVLAVLVFFAFELGFQDVLQLGPRPIAPSFVLMLAVFIAMWAKPVPALWAGLILGALIDLTWTIPRTDGGVATILGPHAMGYMLMTWLVLNIRGMVIKRNPLTMAFLTLIGGIVAQIVVVAMLTIRSLYGDPIPWDATAELLNRVLSAGYSALVAVPISLPLFALAGLFGFHHAHVRRPGQRR